MTARTKPHTRQNLALAVELAFELVVDLAFDLAVDPPLTAPPILGETRKGSCRRATPGLRWLN